MELCTNWEAISKTQSAMYTHKLLCQFQKLNQFVKLILHDIYKCCNHIVWRFLTSHASAYHSKIINRSSWNTKLNETSEDTFFQARESTVNTPRFIYLFFFSCMCGLRYMHRCGANWLYLRRLNGASWLDRGYIRGRAKEGGWGLLVAPEAPEDTGL